ncbi:FAD-dependent oxidoreductase [Acidomonas methanolica]|uniref:FAD-dependent oxidoreductase n=1 Tax=Acidomonas methanolica TaxID=437 RepID=UPI00211A8E9C|nr:FAD-dependent oxidoreductase [Acidomonas methanolica]MCQ9156916.1 FAD-dependent oxidoreductase [Acidomonas methanolica]
MTEEFDADVLICGAGAAGLTLALDLARRGISFRLIDKADEPFPGSRGKGIQPRTLEVFEDLGIVDRIFAAGGPYPPIRVYRADGDHVDTALTETHEPSAAEPYRMPLMVPQFLTERVMRERLLELGHRPEFGCALVGIQQDGTGVTATLKDRSGEMQRRVRYLIGTDGGRSFVRQALDIGFPGETLGHRGLVADVTLTGLTRDAWHRFNEGDRARMIMFCPLAGTEMFQLQGLLPLDGAFDLSAEGLTRLIMERTGRTDIRIQSVSWASTFTMNARLADRYRAGRVFLAGDAAHVHPPTGAQGLNTSVQDAYNLGWKLAAVLHGAPDRLLDSYEEERRPVAAGMLGLATGLLQADLRGQVRRGREVRQLDLAYPGSSLTLPSAERSDRLAAGDRAPDAPVRGASGQPIRLFDLLKGPHWTAFGYEVRHDLVRPRAGLHIHRIGAEGDILDDRGHFRDAYAVRPGDWVFIRPDGYVGAILPSDSADMPENYLRAVGLAADA